MDEKSSKKQDVFIARMLDIMDKNGFNGIVMKGPVLQSIIYTDMPYVRPFGDLDVLLPEEQAIAFHAHLLKMKECNMEEDIPKIAIVGIKQG